MSDTLSSDLIDTEPRLGTEFVIALAGPVGADLSAVIHELRNRLGCYGYEVVDIRLSDLIEHVEIPGVKLSKANEFERLCTYMDGGAAIRRSYNDGGALASMGISELRRLGGGREVRSVKRRMYVLKSLKHPGEVRLLREVYAHGVLVLGVHASPERRYSALTVKRGLREEQARELMRRDESEGDPLGQKTRDVFELADAFVSFDRPPDIGEQVDRVLRLLFGHPAETPTRDEHAMFVALASALRSADLSRQVGAAILNSRGDLVACGANEVPRPGGGVYWAGEAADYRDFRQGFDANHVEREAIGRRIADGFDIPYAKARETLKAAGLFDLTEFGRAVHAEMDALLSCARTGISVVGGSLFTTTFPCHNCAKHIIASGIRRVVYVEPYPKSRAVDLHRDGIAVESSHVAENDCRVFFEPFIGIGPRRYVAFFSTTLTGREVIDRKSADGSAKEFLKERARVRFSLEPSTYFDREDAACRLLDKTPDITEGDDEEDEDEDAEESSQ